MGTLTTTRCYGDADYYQVFLQLVLPLLEHFNPQLVLVSAGYDCAEGDPLGRFSVSPQGFYVMSHLLLASRPVVFILEGGYDVGEPSEGRIAHQPLCTGVAATLTALLEDPPHVEPQAFIERVDPSWQSRVRSSTEEIVRLARERAFTNFGCCAE